MYVYIAGPMTGRPDYNRAAFNAAEARLLAYGYKVYNPARVSERRIKGDLSKSDMIAEQTKQIASSDVIYLLNGWEGSTGARFELQLALMFNLEIQTEPKEDKHE